MTRAIGIAVLASVLLAACGGGAQTTTNPVAPTGGNDNGAPYAGPVARDADANRLEWMRRREVTGKNRKTVLAAIDRAADG